MSRLLLATLFLFLLPSCTRTVEESCTVICDQSAICQRGTDASSCASLCTELATDDTAYAEAISFQADCYEENASHYDSEVELCLAIEGGVCRIEPE